MNLGRGPTLLRQVRGSWREVPWPSWSEFSCLRIVWRRCGIVGRGHGVCPGVVVEWSKENTGTCRFFFEFSQIPDRRPPQCHRTLVAVQQTRHKNHPTTPLPAPTMSDQREAQDFTCNKCENKFLTKSGRTKHLFQKHSAHFSQPTPTYILHPHLNGTKLATSM